jgi:calcium-translocating P-type ATPase
VVEGREAPDGRVASLTRAAGPDTATESPHAVPPRELAAALGSDLARGLSPDEAARRLGVYGPNRPHRRRRASYLRLALNQTLDPLVALLLAAAVISIAIGDTTEGVAIAAILVLNGAIGFWHEVAADRAILALSEAFAHRALVVRDGSETEIPAEEVVPGDLLLVSAGDRVAADARVAGTTSLEVDESALTGESLPVAKQIEPVAAETPLAERASMIHAGTGITHGGGSALVCRTGPRTEVGSIELLAEAAQPPPTPLTLRLGRLARQMVALGVAITIVLGGAILAWGGDWDEAFLTSVAVAVAAVPEGLAATVTAALALGARAMARRGALVRQLSAIETLGETTVICTDKTGTLTENEIRVAGLRPARGVEERELLRGAVLASTAHRVGDDLVGDPIERALLLAAMERGSSREALVRELRRVHEIPFSAERKRMSVVYETGDGRHLFTKGAPEVLARMTTSAQGDLLEAAATWAGEGLRVLAVGSRELGLDIPAGADEAERDLRLLGVVALHDPLRPSAAPAIDAAHGAGIEVRMLTGDHPATARTIGRALDLPDDAILARATPADKLVLVEELQAGGEIVAVTGDGINDAPALRQADVGIAMGRSGTEAAREASAIVLTDDDFSTIVAAIAEGRRIGDNIRKFVAFLLSANFGEVLVFAVAILAGLGAPLAVIQVLIVNLVTDGLPALALARDPASAETMTSPPRRGEQLFDAGTWRVLVWIGILVGGVTFAAFSVGTALGDDVAQTMAFATLGLAELALVYGLRSSSIPAWRMPANRWLDLSVAASLALLAGLVYLPAGHEAFATSGLDAVETLVVAGLAVVPLGGVELLKAVLRRRASHASHEPVARQQASSAAPDASRATISEDTREVAAMNTIVVGVDGSRGSIAALQWAVEEAGLRNARVLAVYAWRLPHVSTTHQALHLLELERDFEQEARALLETVVEEAVPGTPVQVERIVAEGSAASALIAAAESADLLVVGSRGHGGFTGLLLGSVSQQVAEHAPCPVVVVRTRGEGELAADPSAGR